MHWLNLCRGISIFVTAMIVYSPSITNRLRYTCDFIGRELTGRPFELTDDKAVFTAYKGTAINYSHESVRTQDAWIIPHGLLTEKGIRKQFPDCSTQNGRKIFFRTSGEYGFDIFSAVFYLLSRYEEYLPHAKDIYGRFAHENALAFKEGFLNRPLVNEWLMDFGKFLQSRGSIILQTPSFKFHPTYDIDEAFSFLHKGWKRTTGAAIKDLLKGNKERRMLRKKVLAGEMQDPFDAFAWMNTLHENHGLQPKYFFLVAKKTGKLDRNILPSTPALQQLIKEHAAKYAIGIHPSWQSGDDKKLLQEEIVTISSASGKTITASRQHFIRFNLPETYRELIHAGIEEDYSMGYGSINGFRASVASPYYWYDLGKEEQTNLLLFPFCYMDANSFYEQKQTPAQALEEMRYYFKVIKDVNGTMITIWHNTFLGTDPVFKGWREVYERFVKGVVAK